MTTIVKSNSINNQKENITMNNVIDQQLLNYYEQGKRRLVPPKSKKKYMKFGFFGAEYEFSGFNRNNNSLMAVLKELNKFAIDFKRGEENVGKFVFGVPSFIHGTLQETPYLIVGEILEEDKWSFIVGHRSVKNFRLAFDKDSSLYSYFKILDTEEDLENMARVFTDYLEQIWEKLAYCEPYSDLGFQQYLEKTAQAQVVAKYFLSSPIAIMVKN